MTKFGITCEQSTSFTTQGHQQTFEKNKAFGKSEPFRSTKKHPLRPSKALKMAKEECKNLTRVFDELEDLVPTIPPRSPGASTHDLSQLEFMQRVIDYIFDLREQLIKPPPSSQPPLCDDSHKVSSNHQNDELMFQFSDQFDFGSSNQSMGSLVLQKLNMNTSNQAV